MCRANLPAGEMDGGLAIHGLGKKSGLPCLRLWSPICFAVHSEKTRYERGINSFCPKGCCANRACASSGSTLTAPEPFWAEIYATVVV